MTLSPAWVASKSCASPANTESIGLVFWMCHQSIVFEPDADPSALSLRQAARNAAPALAPMIPRKDRRGRPLGLMDAAHARAAE